MNEQIHENIINNFSTIWISIYILNIIIYLFNFIIFYKLIVLYHKKLFSINSTSSVNLINSTNPTNNLLKIIYINYNEMNSNIVFKFIYNLTINEIFILVFCRFIIYFILCWQMTNYSSNLYNQYYLYFIEKLPTYFMNANNFLCNLVHIDIDNIIKFYIKLHELISLCIILCFLPNLYVFYPILLLIYVFYYIYNIKIIDFKEYYNTLLQDNNYYQVILIITCLLNGLLLYYLHNDYLILIIVLFCILQINLSDYMNYSYYLQQILSLCNNKKITLLKPNIVMENFTDIETSYNYKITIFNNVNLNISYGSKIIFMNIEEDEFKKKNLEKINYFLQLISNIHKHNKKIFLEETYIDKKNSFQKKRVLISQSDCNIFYINNTFHDSKFQNQKDHLQYLRELILKNANKFPILIISGDIIFNYFNEEFMEKIKSLPNTVLISDSEKKYTEIIKYNFKEMYI